MGMRDRLRVVLNPARADEELARWARQTSDVRAPRPGEVTEYDPKRKSWHPVSDQERRR